MENNILKNIFNDEFLENLAKSADLYKIGTNSVLDPEEIRIGLKVVPRAVMSMLIAELVPMEINSHKDIKLPFGKNAYMAANKNAADDFTGSVYDNNKLVYDFKNRSIPGLGIILLSTFELYQIEDLIKPTSSGGEDADKKVQKLIDERMEFHSLVNRVVEEKLAQREAVHKLMMTKLTEVLSTPTPPPVASLDITSKDVVKKELDKGETGHEKGVHSAVYGSQEKVSSPGEKALQGQSVAHAFKDVPRTGFSADKPSQKQMHQTVLSDLKSMPKPNLPKSEDMIKKEKGSPLKTFLDRKKKPKEYSVEMAKSETVGCDSCGQLIFGKNSGYSGCLCMGENSDSKIWIKKTENGVQLRFSRGWSPENIEMLLETLRKNNGKN